MGNELILNKKRMLNLDFSRLISIGILIALICMATISNSAFFSLSNILGILEQNSAKGIMALGITFVLITGGIDLSIGNGLTMIAVVASVVHFNSGENAFTLIALCIIVGGLLGSVNGLLIAKLKLLPFVATLGMMSICRGITLWAAEGQMLFLNNPLLLMIGNGKLFGIFPVQALIFFMMAFIAAIVLYRTRLGISIYAMGGNEDATGYCGINTTLQKFKVYVLCSVFLGVASLLTVTRVGQISPNLGEGSMMDAIAAAVIGGTSTMGGRGTVGGTVVGVCIIGVLINSLTFMKVPINGQSVIKGLVILFAIIIDAVFVSIKNKQMDN